MFIPSILGGRRTRLMYRLVSNGMAQSAAMVATAWLIQQTFDRFITAPQSEPISDLIWLGLGLLAAAICIAWLRMVERTDAERLGQDYIHQLRLNLFKHLSAIAPRSMQKRSRGGVMLRFVGDLTALRQWVSLGVARLSTGSITLLMTLSALAFINASLAMSVAAVLIVGAILAYVLGIRMETAVKEARRRRAYLASNVNEKIASLAVVQAFGQTRREIRRVNRQSQRLKKAMIARAKIIGGLRAGTEATTALASSAALLLGAALVNANQVTPGTVVAAMSIVGLLIPALRDLSRVHEYWYGAKVSRDKIQQFLNTPYFLSDVKNAIELPDGLGGLQFNDVSLSGAIKEINATVQANSIVALVGPNGAGKSTLLSLAARFITPTHGNIVLDGQDISTVSLSSLRNAMGIVGPDLPLLRGTIDKNLRYRWRDVPDDEVARIAALCGVDKILNDLPRGGKTRLSEGGANLSVGQRQRIALARAVLGQPRLLLLDEVDANLDPPFMMALRNILCGYQGSVLLVTHHLETLSLADTIWYLEAGELIEISTASEFSKGDGKAAQFFNGPRKMAS